MTQHTKITKSMFLVGITGFFLFIIGAFAIFIYLVATKVDLHLFFMENISEIFSDFPVVAKFVLLKNPYDPSIGSSYPPLAILVLYPFALILNGVIGLENADIIFSYQFWISYPLYIVLCLTAIILLLNKISHFKGKAFLYFILTVIFSGMNLFAMLRGNVIFIALIFLLVYWVYHESENKLLRELALISLAAAGAIKIYPLFFGVVLLSQKRWFESVRVAIYFGILLILPFLAFEGGLSNISLFLDSLGSFGSSSNRILSVRNLSTSGIVYKIVSIFEAITSLNLSKLSSIVSIIVFILVAGVAFFGALFSKSKFSTSIICASICVLLPSVSYFYSTMLLLISLTEFFTAYDSFSKERQRFYHIFFFVFVFVLFIGLPIAIICSIFLIAALFYESVNNLSAYKNKYIMNTL